MKVYFDNNTIKDFGKDVFSWEDSLTRPGFVDICVGAKNDIGYKKIGRINKGHILYIEEQ